MIKQKIMRYIFLLHLYTNDYYKECIFHSTSILRYYVIRIQWEITRYMYHSHLRA